MTFTRIEEQTKLKIPSWGKMKIRRKTVPSFIKNEFFIRRLTLQPINVSHFPLSFPIYRAQKSKTFTALHTRLVSQHSNKCH